tara:strand:+ start:599 stop:988 length:390 start_codon:yes stop_codon:yes gene_type:complete
MSDGTKELSITPGIDFDQIILGMNDQPMKSQGPLDDNGEATIIDMKLGNVICNALMAETEEKIDGIQKLKRFNLARKIQGGVSEDYPTITLNSTKKKLILDVCAKIWGTLIYGRIYEILEGQTEEEEED